MGIILPRVAAKLCHWSKRWSRPGLSKDCEIVSSRDGRRGLLGGRILVCGILVCGILLCGILLCRIPPPQGRLIQEGKWKCTSCLEATGVPSSVAGW
jgi:hypothetical protein